MYKCFIVDDGDVEVSKTVYFELIYPGQSYLLSVERNPEFNHREDAYWITPNGKKLVGYILNLRGFE